MSDGSPFSSLGPDYFLSNDFFKRRIHKSDPSVRVQIPKAHFDAMGLSEGDIVDIIFFHSMIDRPVVGEPRQIRTGRRITVSAEDLPSFVNAGDIHGIGQFYISVRDSFLRVDIEGVKRSEDMLYNRAIFKNKIAFLGGEQNQLRVNIPTPEIDVTGIESGDELRVVAIQITGRRINRPNELRPFRTTVHEVESGHGTTMVFLVPDILKRARGYDEGEYMQYIVRRARLQR